MLDFLSHGCSCACLLGYRGKNCSELDFCVTGECPPNSDCRSLNDGFECKFFLQKWKMYFMLVVLSVVLQILMIWCYDLSIALFFLQNMWIMIIRLYSSWIKVLRQIALKTDCKIMNWRPIKNWWMYFKISHLCLMFITVSGFCLIANLVENKMNDCIYKWSIIINTRPSILYNYSQKLLMCFRCEHSFLWGTEQCRYIPQYSTIRHCRQETHLPVQDLRTERNHISNNRQLRCTLYCQTYWNKVGHWL